MRKIKIVFLVLPNVHLMNLAGPDQVFLEAADYDTPLDIEYCSVGESVYTSAGLPFGNMPHFSTIKLRQNDFLVIPGAELQYVRSSAVRDNSRLFNWIRQCRVKGVKICSICTGAFVLAESGLLDGRICTTHWKRTAELQKQYPSTRVIEDILFTEDDGVFTSAGVASGIDLALHMIEQVKGSYVAYKVAREMVIYNRRSGSDKQQNDILNSRNHIHAGIHKVQDWLHDNLHLSPSLKALAELANMSERNFTRVFKKEVSVTVNQYINLLRSEKIARLLKSPDLSRKQIANVCGLKSERQVSRILSKSDMRVAQG